MKTQKPTLNQHLQQNHHWPYHGFFQGQKKTTTSVRRDGADLPTVVFVLGHIIGIFFLMCVSWLEMQDLLPGANCHRRCWVWANHCIMPTPLGRLRVRRCLGLTVQFEMYYYPKATRPSVLLCFYWDSSGPALRMPGTGCSLMLGVQPALLPLRSFVWGAHRSSQSQSSQCRMIAAGLSDFRGLFLPL